MKTVITLVVVAALLNAVGRTGIAAWRYFEFKDAAQQLVLFGGSTSTNELQSQILVKAEELEVPIEPGAVAVSRDGRRTTAEAYYTQPVELFPRFVYPVDLSFSVEAFAVTVTDEGVIR